VIEEGILPPTEKSVHKFFIKKCKKCQKSIDNSDYRKYNYLVMQLGFSKGKFKKGKRRVHSL
jgi:hypothetical protein